MKELPRWKHVEIGVFLILCAYFCFSALPKAWRTLHTDFPNYYLTARLIRERVDTARAYEWQWIQREKDHRSIDQRVVGLAPITPFSTLLILPIAKLPPLMAKHVWIVVNLGLLIAVCFLLSSISGLSRWQTGILLGASIPLQRNLAFGQYYILLLFVLSAACWASQRRHACWAGTLVGVAAALKIYPILLLLYFLRKKEWKGVAACVVTLCAAFGISILVLGWGMHRTYLNEVLPWTLHGECLPPYNLASQSLSTLLHKLFVYEPQWNPHPAVQAAWLLAVLHPLLQAALMVPAVLWINRRETNADRVALEWSGLLIVALAISTIAASYHLTVLIIPVAVLCAYFLRERKYLGLAWTSICFIAAGYPGWRSDVGGGWHSLLAVPRLYALVLLAGTVIYLLKQCKENEIRSAQMLWALGLATVVFVNIATSLQRQQGMFADYQYRVSMADDALLAANPAAYSNGDVVYVALGKDGYHVSSISSASDKSKPWPSYSDGDQLSVTVVDGQVWTEDVASHSVVRSAMKPGMSISDAESPVFSVDGHHVAFLRDVEGKKQLFVRNASGNERQMTSSPMNVYEAAFLSDASLVFSATAGDANPTLYRLGSHGEAISLEVGEARYPAASADGRWLAYSGFIRGNWNLYLRDFDNGSTKRLTDMPCNQIELSWEADSKTLLYATDCGRALWFTAIARRRVVP
jgi:hypothetical protein